MRILFIGIGSIARKHINALNLMHLDVVIYALRSSKQSTSIDGIVNIYNRNEVRDLDLDFVLISSPTSFHARDIRFCLELKVPLFIEKPVSNTLNLDKILSSEISSKTYIGCNLRFLDCIIFTKRFIENTSSKVNEVNSYCGSFLPEWRPNTDYTQSYSADPQKGGGVHLDLIHEIDYLVWIFGYPCKSKKLLRSNSSLNIPSIDYANYNLIYEDFVANVQLNYFRRDSKRTFEIVFADFTISVNLLDNTVFMDDELIFSSDQTIIDTYYHQMKYFIENMGNGMMNDIYEAYQILKIAL